MVRVLQQGPVVAAGGAWVGVPDGVLNVFEQASGLPGEGHEGVPQYMWAEPTGDIGPGGDPG